MHFYTWKKKNYTRKIFEIDNRWEIEQVQNSYKTKQKNISQQTNIERKNCGSIANWIIEEWGPKVRKPWQEAKNKK